MVGAFFQASFLDRAKRASRIFYADGVRRLEGFDGLWGNGDVFVVDYNTERIYVPAIVDCDFELFFEKVPAFVGGRELVRTRLDRVLAASEIAALVEVDVQALEIFVLVRFAGWQFVAFAFDFVVDDRLGVFELTRIMVDLSIVSLLGRTGGLESTRIPLASVALPDPTSKPPCPPVPTMMAPLPSEMTSPAGRSGL